MIVSNTSPLVYLAALGDFDFLRELFGRIVIPRAVYQEITVGGASLPVARALEMAMKFWLSVHDVTDRPEVNQIQQTGLHSGESEAIVLASELNAQVLLMDDRWHSGCHSARH